MIFKVRTLAKEHITMMNHCSRCRADAAGLFWKRQSGSIWAIAGICLQTNQPWWRQALYCGSNPWRLTGEHAFRRSTIALSLSADTQRVSFYRRAQNSWCGRRRFQVDGSCLKLKDCRAILVGGAGPTPLNILQTRGSGYSDDRPDRWGTWGGI